MTVEIKEITEDEAQAIFQEGTTLIRRLHESVGPIDITPDTARAFQVLTHVIMSLSRWMELYPENMEYYAHNTRLAVQAIYLLSREDAAREQLADSNKVWQ